MGVKTFSYLFFSVVEALHVCAFRDLDVDGLLNLVGEDLGVLYEDHFGDLAANYLLD